MSSLEEAAEIVYMSRNLVEENYPGSVYVFDWAMVIIDRGSYWEVTFIQKPPSTRVIFGGAPVFHLEKGSLRLIESFHTQ